MPTNRASRAGPLTRMSRMSEVSAPSGHDAVSAALQRLTTEPTNAQIVSPSPTEHPAADPADRTTSVAGWWSCATLCEPSFWQSLARSYSTGLGTEHLPAGGACALQHYAGRFVLPASGAWGQTGSLLSMDHPAWRARFDDDGRTTGMTPPTGQTATPAGVTDAAHALLHNHMRPIVDAVRSASRITDRVAYG